MVIAIFGPTASGKTAVAEAVAGLVGGEVVSCDSMQAYRGLPILTCQPARPTRLVGIWPLDHEGSVGEYARLAHAAIDELLAAGRTPVVAGGTGLYLRAALAELGLPPAPPAGARARWEEAYDRDGAAEAHRRLAGARSRGGGRRPRERPQARRAGARAGRSRRVARPGRRPALGRRDTPPDAPGRPRRAAARSCSAGSSSERRRCSRPASRTRCATALARTGLDHRPQGARARRGGGAAAGRGARRDRHPHPPVRGVPAQVDAAYPRPRYGQRGSPRRRGRR